MLVEISERTMDRIKSFERQDRTALTVDEINNLKKTAREVCHSLSNDINNTETLSSMAYEQEQRDTHNSLRGGE
jgi:hypothetical protein